jgi:hypothetical protein
VADGADAGRDLWGRDMFVFVSSSWRSRRLDHRIDDRDGHAIGSALEHPRPAWWEGDSNLPKIGKRAVHVYDSAEVKVLEVVRTFGVIPRVRRLRVAAGEADIGTVAPVWRSLFAILDRDGDRIGTIERRGRGNGVDFVVTNAADVEVGWISDFAHMVHRRDDEGAAPPPWSRKRLSLRSQPDEHVLEITQPVGRDLRILMFASAAGLYTLLQEPFFDNG